MNYRMLGYVLGRIFMVEAALLLASVYCSCYLWRVELPVLPLW